MPLFCGIQIATSSHMYLMDEITLDLQEPIYTQELSEAYNYRFTLFKHTGLAEAT